MTNETNFAFVAEHRQTLLQRMWKALGYGLRYDESYFDWRWEDPKDGDWWVPGTFNSHTVIHVDWRDRLRLLLSGRCTVETASRTNVSIGRAETRSRFAVLHPHNPAVEK